MPKTITSDCGLQFTSNLWFQLYEILNISHKQTTAYHPELNGAVKRQHRLLKDALRTHAAAATWSEELPFVLLGLRAQPREDTGLSLAEAAFGAQGSVGAAWFHPFSRSMTAPTRFCAVAPSPSPSESGRGTRWLPSAALRLAWPRTPHLAARVAAADRRARTQAVLPQPSGSRSQTRWSLHLLLLRRCHMMVLEPFSYPARRFLHARDQWRLHSLHRRVPVSSTGTAPEVGPLTSSPPSRGQRMLQTSQIFKSSKTSWTPQTSQLGESIGNLMPALLPLHLFTRGGNGGVAGWVLPCFPSLLTCGRGRGVEDSP